MTTTKVISLAGKRAASVPEKEFLSLIDRDIQANPDNIKPIPSSIFDRFEALKVRMQTILDSQVKEG